MPVSLPISVENPDELLNDGMYGAGAVVRIQSSATESGSYADLTGGGSTPTVPLEAGRRSYTAYDPSGGFSTWYRSRFESVGATRVSVDWAGDASWATRLGHAPFQVGSEEGSGLLCSLDDARQRLSIDRDDHDSDEDLLEFIGQVSTAVMGYTGRQFARTPASGERTFLFDVPHACGMIRVPKGIASASLLEAAPNTGGTFATVISGDWYLDPPETERDYGWPATRIVLSDVGSVSEFATGRRNLRMTGALGWPQVPGDIAGIALTTVIRRWQARASGQTELIGSSEFGTKILRWISPEERATLDWYRSVTVG